MKWRFLGARPEVVHHFPSHSTGQNLRMAIKGATEVLHLAVCLDAKETTDTGEHLRLLPHQKVPKEWLNEPFWGHAATTQNDGITIRKSPLNTLTSNQLLT